MRFAHLPLDLLRTFLWVAERGGVSRAAETLGRSQPAISLQLKRLEQLAGGPILKLQGRQWTMTERGEILAAYARQLLKLNDEALDRLLRPKVSGKVRIGIPNDYADTFLSRILAGFGELHDAVNLEVTCELSINLLDLLKRDQLDLALAIPDGPTPLESLAMWPEKIVWVGVPGLKLSPDQPLPLVLYPEGCGYRRRLLKALEAKGRTWRIAYSSASLVSLQAALQAGLGVTVLAEQVMPQGLQVIDSGLPQLPGIELGLFSGSGGRSPAAQRLADHIKDTLTPLHA